MRLIVSLAAVAALLFAPHAALAAPNAAKTAIYHTAYRPTIPTQTAGEVTGELHLTFGPDGTVSGMYREPLLGGFSNLAGRVSGADIWFSFGGGYHFRGVIEKNRTIIGILSDARGARAYHFRAVPTTS